jgi:2-dehydro-3-deoxygalactonokinase
MEKYLLSCDWGSTAFRLRLIEMPGQNVVGEISSVDGIISTYTSWQEAYKEMAIERRQFFLYQLEKQRNKLADELGVELNEVPIIISGMASSSIGLHELPYAELPFSLDGNGVAVQAFEDEISNPVMLISGAKNENDVMRGEETQLVGLAALLNLYHQEAIVILPGTHSKHLHIKNGQLTGVETYMTGELFALLTTHSILKDSITKANTVEPSEGEKAAFVLGLNRSKDNNLLNNLFTVRINHLLTKLNKEQNFYYLSGLLIGAEISRLHKTENIPLLLCGGGSLNELYKLGLQEFELLENTTIVSAETITKATIAGQVIIRQKNR